MSRAWIAFYMGDYDKDTQALSTLEHGAYFLLLKQCWVHGVIPLEAAKRANIAKMSLRDWNKIAATINSFFDDEGRNKRATREIEKADVVRTRRAIAGQQGGFASGISKAIRKGEQSKREANAKQRYEQISQPSEATLRSSKLTTASLVETGEGLGKGKVEKSSITASSHLLANLQGKANA